MTEAVGPAGEQHTPGEQAEQTEPRLLELLVCPSTRTTLIYNRERHELVSRAAGLAYPIRHGVPMMTPDAARTLDPHEK